MFERRTSLCSVTISATKHPIGYGHRTTPAWERSSSSNNSCFLKMGPPAVPFPKRHSPLIKNGSKASTPLTVIRVSETVLDSIGTLTRANIHGVCEHDPKCQRNRSFLRCLPDHTPEQ